MSPRNEICFTSAALTHAIHHDLAPEMGTTSDWMNTDNA